MNSYRMRENKSSRLQLSYKGFIQLHYQRLNNPQHENIWNIKQEN